MLVLFFQKWGRQYFTVGIYLKQNAVNVLTALNHGTAEYQSTSYDRKFVKTVMQEVFGSHQLTTETHLEPAKIEFVKGKTCLTFSMKFCFHIYQFFFSECFKQRVGEQTERFKNIEYHINMVKVQLCYKK